MTQQQHVVEVHPSPERGANGDAQRTASVDIPAPPIASGNGDGRRWDESRPAFDRVAVAQFAMILFIVVEAMTFAGLISAYFSIRGSVDFWPPLDQPRYPVQATAINTAILLASGATMLLFRRVWHRDPDAFGKLTLLLLATAFLGALFVGLQGIEWAQLLGYGLTVTSSAYGPIFYVIVGFHAFPVLAAPCGLFAVPARFAGGGRRFTAFLALLAAWGPCGITARVHSAGEQVPCSSAVYCSTAPTYRRNLIVIG